jgi:cytochrome c biogenesis protein ResB
MNVQWFFAILIFFFVSLVGIALVWSLVREPDVTVELEQTTQSDRLDELHEAVEEVLERVEELQEHENRPPRPERKPTRG